MTATDLPVLAGPRVTLRAPDLADADAWSRLDDDPEIVRMYGGSAGEVQPMTPERAARVIDSFIRHGHAWIIAAPEPIGHIRLDRIDRKDRRASLALGIADPARLGQGLGREAIRLVLQHAFDRMKLHRIALRVVAYNTRAIRAYRSCGFVFEGREREAALVDGIWHDDILMGILDREFRALPPPVQPV